MDIMMQRVLRGLVASVISCACSAVAAQERKLDSESYFIPSSDAGVQLYIRNKHPAGVSIFGGERTLLFVHGATYPSETTFDFPFAGKSMMDHIAEQGWDVYLVDVRGYGGSSRPPEMDAPAQNNKPIVNTLVGVRDVAAAVDHILKKRAVPKINLMGWSWGTAVMGIYTAEHNEKVNRLVQYAPLWLWNPGPPVGGDGPLGAYRSVPKGTAKARWLLGVPEDKKGMLIPAGWFDQWEEATWATDPTGSKQNPPVLRAPNGVLQDLRDYWTAGKPSYNPEQIGVPTLLLHAEWDAELPSYQAQAYFSKLTNAPYKRFVEIGEGTHQVMMEKNRMQFFRELMKFLNEKTPQALN
jgi:pimeloyl-ACP methyl ester carboxylesterase